MPRPVSRTVQRRTLLAVAAPRTSTVPPRRLYLIALDSRLISTWRSRVGSAERPPSAAAVGDERDAVLRRQRLHQRQRLAHERAEVDRLQRQPDLARFQARQIEHVVDQREQVIAGGADVLELGELRRHGAACRASSCSSWVKPSTALSGVRSSWLMRERNCDLAWISRSASARLLARQLGVLGFGDVPVDADAAHRRPRSSSTAAERDASQR